MTKRMLILWQSSLSLCLKLPGPMKKPFNLGHRGQKLPLNSPPPAHFLQISPPFLNSTFSPSWIPTSVHLPPPHSVKRFLPMTGKDQNQMQQERNLTSKEQRLVCGVGGGDAPGPRRKHSKTLPILDNHGLRQRISFCKPPSTHISFKIIS